ncbi:DCL family protein [Bradyrhizobium sp. dw_411]|uniref:DCL family protein n=1 Tax=Bradyrhizobium sp. dw_411 TaxID=2720082 RepID=UPI001BCF843F|nr:DCL family protein [Bradyrhizobium sp. dw_411]
MAKSINLPNGRSWKTQTTALAHFKDMLARHSDNEVVEDRSDHDDLVALLERYDAVITDSPAKIGSGVEHFFRRRNVGEGYSTPGFWVHRTDGTDTDFSYISAVKGQPKSNAQEFYDACRGAVAADLLTAKKRHFETHGDEAGRVPCDLSDELITFAEAHLDHAYPTFGQLVVSFRAARGWQHGVPVGVLSPPADAQITTSFVDTSAAEAFRQFHRGAATLRIVSRERNLAMSAGQRKPKIKRPVQLEL